MAPSDDRPSGQRVVLGRKDKTSSMTPFRWSGAEPSGMSDVESAEELGAQWEGDELVVYDITGFTQLFETYESGDYTFDND